MKREDINIRDPYILAYDEKYYLYGTRSKTCWGKADGFDCYISEDLKEWKGPIEIFHKPEGFFANESYWAPECYFYNDEFYLVTTLGATDKKKGIYVLKSNKPDGSFSFYSGPLTPKEWSAIDGTLYFDEEKIYLIFSHSFEDNPNGDMCVVEVSKDLKKSIGEPVKLFSASEVSWAKPVPFAEKEFGLKGDVYLTDGPCVTKLDNGSLCMIWSSWSNRGYAVGQAISECGSIFGPWKQVEVPLFRENGGHGMLFTAHNNDLKYTLHFPNDLYKERPIFKDIEVRDNIFSIVE